MTLCRKKEKKGGEALTGEERRVIQPFSEVRVHLFMIKVCQRNKDSSRVGVEYFFFSLPS